MQRTITATVALTTAATLTTASLAGAGSALASTHWRQTDRAGVAAGYLANHLAGPDHDHYTVDYGGTTYDDDGATADAVLSMDAAGAAQQAAHRATRFLAHHVGDYAVTSYGTYPGAVAKLLLVALAQNRDSHTFGGTDLVAAIKATEGTEGAPTGEYQQNPGYPNSDSYVVSQALPVLALSLVSDGTGGADDAAVSFLAGQQCPDGAFATLIRADTSTDCADNDVDTTAYAVQALLAAGAAAPANAGLAWLKAARNSDGGYGAPDSNANSTALTVQALLAAHADARSGMAWLRRHQLGCDAKPSRRGAVTFQQKYDAGALRATTQATAALAGRPLAWINRSGASADAPELSC